MAMRYCPVCKRIADVRALGNYSQVEIEGKICKKRKVIHREEEGGCGCTWYTLEFYDEDSIECPAEGE